MENKFNNLIKAMKNEKMTGEEKTSIRFRVETFANNNPVKGFPSPYLKISPYFSKFSFANLSKIVGTALLLTIIGVGGLTYASASALPGDLLYPIKINIKEKIEEKLAFTMEEKNTVKYKKIETRFKEVETLIKKNKITPEKRAIAETGIATEKQNIENNLEVMSKEDPEVANLTKTNLEALIQTHQEKIDTLIEEKGDEVEFIENELANGEASFEEEYKIDLEIMEKVDILDNIDNLDPQIKDELLIQDAEIIPSVAPDLSTGSAIPATSDKIDCASSNTEEEKQANP